MRVNGLARLGSVGRSAARPGPVGLGDARGLWPQMNYQYGMVGRGIAGLGVPSLGEAWGP